VSAVAQHDFVGRVAEEVRDLQREVQEAGVSEALAQVSERLSLPPELALAAIYRAARRSGLTVRQMLADITAQLDLAERPRA
jgi:hypothetical protein